MRVDDQQDRAGDEDDGQPRERGRPIGRRGKPAAKMEQAARAEPVEDPRREHDTVGELVEGARGGEHTGPQALRDRAPDRRVRARVCFAEPLPHQAVPGHRVGERGRRSGSFRSSRPMQKRRRRRKATRRRRRRNFARRPLSRPAMRPDTASSMNSRLHRTAKRKNRRDWRLRTKAARRSVPMRATAGSPDPDCEFRPPPSTDCSSRRMPKVPREPPTRSRTSSSIPDAAAPLR